MNRGVQLAGGGAKGEQPLLGLVQTPRLEVEGGGGGVDLCDGLKRLHDGAVDGLGGGAQAGDDRMVGLCAVLQADGLDGALAGVFDRTQGRRQLLAQLVAAQLGPGVGQISHGLFGGAENGALPGQFGLLVLARIQGVEVGEVEGDFFGPGRGVGGRRLKPGQMRLGGLQGLAGGGDRGQLGRQAAIGVQQRPVGAPVQQADGLMLAVHLDQTRADLAQGRDPGRLIVDIGPAAAVGGQNAAQDQILARRDLEPALGDQGDQVGIVGSRKDGGRAGLFGAGADQAGLAAPAQRQTQGVQDDRLAGPRLAGQHGQAGLDVQIEHIDQDDVPD